MPAAQMAPLFAALQRTAKHEGTRGARLPVLSVLAGLPGARAAMRRASSTYAERGPGAPPRTARRGPPSRRRWSSQRRSEVSRTRRRRCPSSSPRSVGTPTSSSSSAMRRGRRPSRRVAGRSTATSPRTAAGGARRQARALYDSRLEEVPDAERQFLEAAAAVDQMDRTTAGVAAELGGTSEAWGWARRRLTDRGLLRSGPRGRIVFALPGLDEHLRER